MFCMNISVAKLLPSKLSKLANYSKQFVLISRHLDITAISIVGGKLNDKIDNSLSTEENHELIVIGLSKVGNLYIWKESDPIFARCIFSINRFLKIRQVTLNLNEILFVTHQGEAFQGILKPRKRKTTENNLHIKKSAFHEFLEKDNCQLLKVSKISRVHRAVSIHSDLKGRNYAVLQVGSFWKQMHKSLVNFVI